VSPCFKRLAALLLLAAILAAGTPARAEHARHGPVGEATCPTVVRFSPHGGAERLVVDTLRQARERVHAALYGLTSPAIEAALRDLARGGVRVAIKADRVQSTGKAQAALIERLRESGASVEVSQIGRLLHHKFAVVDGRWVITGSFNWTGSAEHRNRENVLVLDCPELARLFEAEWEIIAPDQP
jgi:phosphatidylserine/phosphatidylglycerophosphate/cardiolipin synthase-like enzyme